MAEEQVNAPTTSEAAATPSETPTEQVGASDSRAAEAPAPQAGGDLMRALDSVSPDELLRHPRVAGIFGDRLQKERTRLAEQIRREQQEEAARRERERLKELRRSDPVAYAELMETREAEDERRREMEGLAARTRDQFARRIAETIQSLPEFKELTPEEIADIAAALAGKSDDEVLGVFTVKHLEHLSKKRAAKLLREWTERELAKEREAIRAEITAEMLKSERAPDLKRPSGPPPKFDPARLPDDKFNEWWEKHFR